MIGWLIAIDCVQGFGFGRIFVSLGCESASLVVVLLYFGGLRAKDSRIYFALKQNPKASM